MQEVLSQLFDPGPPEPEPEPMSADRRRTQRRRELLDRGINPGSGRAIADNGEFCGTCAHIEVHCLAKTYFKCGKVLSTAGPATDIRVSWPACVLWEPRG